MGLREKLYFRALKMLTAAIVHLISGKRRETIHLALIIALAKMWMVTVVAAMRKLCQSLDFQYSIYKLTPKHFQMYGYAVP